MHTAGAPGHLLPHRHGWCPQAPPIGILGSIHPAVAWAKESSEQWGLQSQTLAQRVSHRVFPLPLPPLHSSPSLSPSVMLQLFLFLLLPSPSLLQTQPCTLLAHLLQLQGNQNAKASMGAVRLLLSYSASLGSHLISPWLVSSFVNVIFVPTSQAAGAIQ